MHFARHLGTCNDMADYEAAVERAQSRAAVLQSLHNAYGGPTAATSAAKSAQMKFSGKPAADQKKQQDSAAGTSDKGVVVDVVECLLASIGDQTVKTRQFFRDSLRGKAIVVENLKAQVEASKASKKIERASKRKHTMSNRAMKRRHVADPLRLPSPAETLALHDMWWEYAAQVVTGCHSEAQLQARLQAIECVGARAHVLNAVNKHLIGAAGIITAVSKNCYYLALDAAPAADKLASLAGASGGASVSAGIGAGKNVESQGTQRRKHARPVDKALLVVKDECILGLVLPNRGSGAGSGGGGGGGISSGSAGAASAHKTEQNLFRDEAIPGGEQDEAVDTASMSAQALAQAGGTGFDRYERQLEGKDGRMCVLYGKHYLPHCARPKT